MRHLISLFNKVFKKYFGHPVCYSAYNVSFRIFLKAICDFVFRARIKAKLNKKCNLKTIVGPATKLHLTGLIIKREPGDINGTGGLEHARWYVGTQPLTGHHNVGRICRVECLAGTGNIG